MRVNFVVLTDFRSFEHSGTISMDAITILIGPNNSGKSSVIRSIHLLQDGADAGIGDVRKGKAAAEVHIGLNYVRNNEYWGGFGDKTETNIKITIKESSPPAQMIAEFHNGWASVGKVRNIAPRHLIVPFLSRRKTAIYQEDVRQQNTNLIGNDMSFLAARLSKIANPGHPSFQKYSDACKRILGFLVTAVSSDGGQRPGVYLSNGDTLDISQMGEGVPNIVSLLIDLSSSEGKIFLIEEPENDLHPQALKALLDFILESSGVNQFIVSTHSNVVLRYLGSAQNSCVYSIGIGDRGELPVKSTISKIENSPGARLAALQELGYSFSDFDLWEGWLFLEESSAERIIRDYLIPWFAPRLSRLRTLAAGGISKVEPCFEDFNRLVRFTHLESVYAPTTWVRVDGDEVGIEVIRKLREGYPKWDQGQFNCFASEQFEKYYPEIFSPRIESVLEIKDKKSKREEKAKLLSEVISWLDEDEGRGRLALEASAAEIIDDLKKIESKVFKG